MDVKVEAAAFSATVTVKRVTVAARAGDVMASISIPRQRAAASPYTISFGKTSLNAVAPDLFQNGGLYALA